jgi:hypothetical protein
MIFNGVIGQLVSIMCLTFDLKLFIERLRDIGGGGFNPFALGHYHHFTTGLPRPPPQPPLRSPPLYH